jgi:hypothetical protein
MPAKIVLGGHGIELVQRERIFTAHDRDAIQRH